MIPSPYRRLFSRSLLLFACCFSAASCEPLQNQALAAPSAEDEEPEPVALTVFTDAVELFMEYPRLVPGLEARFLAHVTVLADGAPVRSGKLRLELSQPNGAPRVLLAEAPTRDGLFIPLGSFEAPGVYPARIVVESDQVQATIELEPIVVHADLDAAFAAAEADAQPEPRDAVPFLLETQWKIELLMQKVERRTLIERLQVAGEIQAPQHAHAAVSSTLAGRLLPPPGGRLPRIGELVEKGQVLARIEPPLSTSDRAQLLANQTTRASLEMDLQLREYDLKSKTLELALKQRQAATRLDYAQRAWERITALRAKDLGTQAGLESAAEELALAQQSVASAQAMAESYAAASQQLQGLREGFSALEPAASEQEILLVAPISGEVDAALHVEGEHVESNGVLYRLINFEQLWVSAHVSEFDFARLGETPGALVRLAADPAREFDVLKQLGGRVVHVGHVVDPASRTIELSYEIPNPDRVFRSGMFADIFLETQTSRAAVAIPQEAIVTDNGQPVAFVLLHGELFQKRVLELGIRDGDLVEVLSGVSPGERVVTQGAYLVKLASASPAAFGEGHAH